ncbi:hypothetical protein QTP86_004209 [Hemibagrus guttatus]|nr:hypothetical protein QTP86_004209 [Hemibagrus guttatus]
MCKRNVINNKYVKFGCLKAVPGMCECRKMASISRNQDQFSCPVCLDLLKDPVTLHCGHSYCKVCINGHWDQEDVKGIYSCPQCRETFTPRPVLRRNNMLAEVLEKLKKTELQAAHCYAGPGDVECDFCTGRKHKAVKSCLVCQASYCEDHLKPHYQSPAFKKHKLVEACAELQEKICSEHDKLMEIYCRTDQSFICYLCTMEKHKGHDTVSIKTERTEKQTVRDSAIRIPRGSSFRRLGARTEKSLDVYLPFSLRDGGTSRAVLVDLSERGAVRGVTRALSYQKPVEGTQQWGGVGELGQVENKSCSCILDHLQWTNCV